MSSNIGGTDRAIRFLIGAAVLSLTVIGPQSAWGFVGLIPMLTAVVGWCPLYTVFGISTCKTHTA